MLLIKQITMKGHHCIAEHTMVILILTTVMRMTMVMMTMTMTMTMIRSHRRAYVTEQVANRKMNAEAGSALDLVRE